LLDRFLRRKNQAENIHVEVFVKLLLCDLFEGRKLVDARVVNQNIELTESRLRFGKETFDLRLLGDIGLHSNGLSAMADNFGDDFVSSFFTGSIINDHGRAFGREMFGDVGADSLGRTGHDRDFTGKFLCIRIHLFCIVWYITSTLDKRRQAIIIPKSMKVKKTRVLVGRPREFDADDALNRALHVFWHKGYEGASLSDLTKAMGINRPSLYAAFGNKEQLFRKALDRYAEGPAAYVRKALDAPTARAVVERLLRGAIDMVTDPRTPAGCFMVQGALACGDAADSIRREVSARRGAAETTLRRRFQRGKREGDLPSKADSADLARYIATVMHGMAVQRAGGATRAQLLRVMKTALRAWPN
jgi:AcrR family transcriptional regulator